MYWDHLTNRKLWESPWYAMVIPTIPSEFPFWQDLVRCDYFRTSLKIAKADIYKVGDLANSKYDGPDIARSLEGSWLVSCMHWWETGTNLSCFVVPLSVYIQLFDTLDYLESKISRPREVKDIPWVDCVPIIIDSMIGRLTGLSECHSTIKLAPDPPLLSFCGMI